MYTFFLAVHNILRWIVLILLILALIRSFWGWFGKREYTLTDRRAGMFYSISLDIQVLLGLLLYFVYSPITKSAMRDFSNAMSNSDLRFFALEHLLYMILALILAHVGVVTARRATEDVAKHRRAAIWFSLSFIAILLGMPWFRPLLPGLG
jgi:hypothetical protein